MTEMYARNDNKDWRGDKDNAPNSFTLFVKGYPYMFGRVYPTKDGQYKIYSTGRSDRGWAGVYDEDKDRSFATVSDALAHARLKYETNMARYHSMCVEVMTALNQGLSKVEHYDKRYSEDTKIIVRIGLPNLPHCSGQFNMVLTVQEAITALDYLYKRIGATVSIIGGIYNEDQNEHKNGYANWIIPTMSNDYHIAGHRSLEGVGRHG